MADVKVLVVDDSLTMRVLISGALERIKGVQVVGAADGAAEAREMVKQYRPEVMTLDVEMPGMSGLEYLAEIMEERPMPVIMFSTRTAAGATESVEALRLGAIDCFPKPRVAAPAELDVIIKKLAKRLKAAKKAEVKGPKAAKAGEGDVRWILMRADLAVPEEGDEGEHIMRALSEERMIVAERVAALGQDDLVVARGFDLLARLRHVLGRDELPVLDVHDGARLRGCDDELRLHAEISGDLDHVADFRRRRRLFCR